MFVLTYTQELYFGLKERRLEGCVWATTASHTRRMPRTTENKWNVPGAQASCRLTAQSEQVPSAGWSHSSAGGSPRPSAERPHSRPRLGHKLSGDQTGGGARARGRLGGGQGAPGRETPAESVFP